MLLEYRKGPAFPAGVLSLQRRLNNTINMTFIGRIRSSGKRAFDRMRNEKFKYNLLQAIPFWIASLLTGLVAVVYTRLFALAEKGTAYIVHLHLWLLFLITPATFVLAWWLVRQFAPFSRGSGIPQVMASIELATPKYNAKVNQLLSLRILFIKILSSLVMAFGGGVIGREGPTIQVAGSIFRKVNEWLPKWWPKVSKRNMIMTGAAAGLAAAFNTPLGRDRLRRGGVDPDTYQLFQDGAFYGRDHCGLDGTRPCWAHISTWVIPMSVGLSGTIFFGVLLVAVPAGIAGAGMAKCMLRLFANGRRSFNSQRGSTSFTSIGCALVLADACEFCIDERVLGSGKELMTTAPCSTDQKYNSWYMPLLRIVGPILSFTTGASGGVFAPALSAGASIGATISGWMHLVARQYQPHHPVRHGRLPDGGHPDTIYFGHTRAGNDRSPQCDLPSDDGRDGRQSGGDGCRPAFILRSPQISIPAGDCRRGRRAVAAT
jgi:H+/Cl- antiporter ClcA